jgi:hypothetical protein
MSKWLAGLTLGIAAVANANLANAEEAVRNYGSTDIAPAVASDAAPTAVVAFGHHRKGCCGGASSFSAAYGAYSTYQPSGFYSYSNYLPGQNYGRYYGFPGSNGYYGSYYRGNGAPWVYNTPNPYGYYPNGQIWGSSGPTYAGPFPVWNSPSGVYDYRYNGWGSYGWGGWGGTGPAGWGYQGGFYW